MPIKLRKDLHGKTIEFLRQEEILALIEENAYHIVPISLMASKLNVTPHSYYNECYKEGSPVQLAHLKGEEKRLDYETNYITTLRRCHFTGDLFRFKKSDGSERKITITKEKLAFQIQSYIDFMKRFNNYSLSQSLQIRLYSGSKAPFSKERDLSDLRFHIISKLDDELGRKGQPEDSSFDVERLRLLGKEVHEQSTD